MSPTLWEKGGVCQLHMRQLISISYFKQSHKCFMPVDKLKQVNSKVRSEDSLPTFDCCGLVYGTAAALLNLVSVFVANRSAFSFIGCSKALIKLIIS